MASAAGVPTHNLLSGTPAYDADEQVRRKGSSPCCRARSSAVSAPAAAWEDKYHFVGHCRNASKISGVITIHQSSFDAWLRLWSLFSKFRVHLSTDREDTQEGSAFLRKPARNSLRPAFWWKEGRDGSGQ